ncbi:MAG: hypothetical protein MJZ77_04855 [Bacteroidales bacterium]|nr:hypothetical protein [Bacteroidales bacterium]
MKKYIFALLILYGISASAQQQVHLNEIVYVSNNYAPPTKQSNNDVDTIYCEVDSLGDTVLYQILYKDKSFVLLSGSKACLPILAYGEAGSSFPIWDITDAIDTIYCKNDDGGYTVSPTDSEDNDGSEDN